MTLCQPAAASTPTPLETGPTPALVLDPVLDLLTTAALPAGCALLGLAAAVAALACRCRHC